MSVFVARTLDFNNTTRIVNLPDGTLPQHPATVAQLNAAVEGLAWKDSCRVATQADISISSPGSTIDGISMVAGDRVLVKANTASSENGIYIWNGSAVAMTRALDMDIATEVEGAILTVEEGTSANTTFRQSSVNVTLGTTALNWSIFGTSAGAASTSSAGIVQLATQTIVNTGTDAAQAITPSTLAGSIYAKKTFNATVGDGTSTSITLSHNFNTRDVRVTLYRNSGNYDEVMCEVQHSTVNTVTLIFDAAPTTAQYACTISN